MESTSCFDKVGKEKKELRGIYALKKDKMLQLVFGGKTSKEKENQERKRLFLIHEFQEITKYHTIVRN